MNDDQPVWWHPVKSKSAAIYYAEKRLGQFSTMEDELLVYDPTTGQAYYYYMALDWPWQRPAPPPKSYAPLIQIAKALSYMATPMPRFFASLLRLVLPPLLALIACALLIRLAGSNPLTAGAALWNGATGSRLRLAETGAKTIPLIMTGLSVAIAFRAGFFNVGAEGQFLMGAIAATALGAKCSFAWPIVLVGGAVAGALWALIAGWMKVKRGASEIITTIMLNYVALQLVTFAVMGPLKEHANSQPQSDILSPGSQLPALVSGSNLHVGLFIALLAAPLAWVFLFRTAKGFEWRASGSGEKAARIAGIAVTRNQLSAVALSGALSGLGGAMEIAGATKQLNVGGFGYGYTAIAVALLADLNPLGVLPAALGFGLLSAGGGAMERNAKVPAVAVSMVIGVVIFALAALSRKRRD